MKKFNNVLVLVNKIRNFKVYIKKISIFLNKNGINFSIMDTNKLNFTNTNFDIALIIGGDGVFINSSKKLLDFKIPVIGLNNGFIGFLTEIEKSNINKLLDDIFINYEFKINKKILLEIRNMNGISYALNDIIFTNKHNYKSEIYKLYIDNKMLYELKANGIIISTPTGSTGFSLSCNGPIVLSNVDCFIINPIFPHSLKIKPIIISSNSKIKIIIEEIKNIDISVDGKLINKKLDKNKTSFEILKSNKKIDVIETKNYNIIKNLTSKLL